jgi:hypothetical protein
MPRLRTPVLIGALVLAVLFALLLFVSLSRPGESLNLFPSQDFVRLHNDTAGPVVIQARCPRLLREANVCEFRELPLFGSVPAGTAVVVPAQPPPGATTWFRVSDATQRTLGCMSVKFAMPNQSASTTEIPVVNVTQLAPCPDWTDDLYKWTSCFEGRTT